MPARKGAKARGVFITFEGTDGAGKSTLIGLLADRLKQQGRSVTVTREPGGSPVAERIREILLKEAMDPWTELFLYEASRAEHLARTILPALERGDWVLCDRFADSSLAYQGQARGLPWAEVERLNKVATRGLKPDLTVWLDVDPATGLDRVRDKTRFEAEGLEFQKRVRAGFARAARQAPKRWLKLKTESAGPDELAVRVLTRLTKLASSGAGRATWRA
jgi:dTMP kinase